MNLEQEVLRAWSLTTDSEVELADSVARLKELATQCKKQPGLSSALEACGGTRNVWDTAEGLTHADSTIDPRLLARAIKGIECCIVSVSKLRPPQPADVEHISKMIAAMTERRDQLSVLLKDGKVAFTHHLKMGRPV